MLHYHIHTIPHEAQRYDTVGDYWREGVHDEIRISNLPDDRMEFCIMLHELIEDFLCKSRGIDEETHIKPFDIAFEQARIRENLEEPGDDPSAPYHKEHVFAEGIERQIAEELGLSWDDYTEAVNAL